MLVRHLPPNNANNIKCQQLLLKFDAQAKDWQMGHSKVRMCVREKDVVGRCSGLK